MSDVADRLTEYLLHGGLYNPELMQHEKVRDLLIDCRDEIARLRLAIRLLAEQDATLSVCKTCGLMNVRRGGELVTLVNWKKNLVSPSPCPECMEEAGKAMAAFGARVAAARNDAFWQEFNRAE